jgi:hypothetical protein
VEVNLPFKSSNLTLEEDSMLLSSLEIASLNFS